MGMTKKQLAGALDVLGVVDPYGAVVEQADGEMLITPELEACHPDQHQPRHVLPGDLRERVVENACPAEVLWEAWQRCLGDDLYQALRSHALSPAEALAKRREEGALDLALQLTLEGLADLADSIARHGLRQPLNVYELGEGQYRIAEGERRWWAHVLLRDALLRIEASTILARVHPLPGDALAVLARQQAENAHRRDLSAIARARAIARVREAVVQGASGTSGSWEGTGAGTLAENELDDLTGERLAELTGKGMSGRMVRYYLALLSLPPQAQALAEAVGLAERALRPIATLDNPDRQIRLVHALAAGEMTPTQAAAEVKACKVPGEQPIEDHLARSVAGLQASLRFAAGDLPEPARVATRAAQLPPKKRAEIVAQARRYAAFLNAFLAAFPEGEKGAENGLFDPHVS
jgi:hypothetical protein